MGDQPLADLLRTRGITDERVLKAIACLDRRDFVPGEYAEEASADAPIPIGYGQTISQPYIVAYMTQELRLRGEEKVLEIGTGSGYQTAVLALLCAEVYSIEIVPELAERSRQRLMELGFLNVFLREGDGHRGWPEAAPFHGILLTAAPEQIPELLLDQMRPGGRLIAPLGPATDAQELVLVRKGDNGANRYQELLPVRFVPMTGESDLP
jgi:protein-L-isoaspartate(D-aspartate) O-methyltransferase